MLYQRRAANTIESLKCNSESDWIAFSWAAMGVKSGIDLGLYRTLKTVPQTVTYVVCLSINRLRDQTKVLSLSWVNL